MYEVTCSITCKSIGHLAVGAEATAHHDIIMHMRILGPWISRTSLSSKIWGLEGDLKYFCTVVVSLQFSQCTQTPFLVVQASLIQEQYGEAQVLPPPTPDSPTFFRLFHSRRPNLPLEQFRLRSSPEESEEVGVVPCRRLLDRWRLFCFPDSDCISKCRIGSQSWHSSHSLSDW